MPDVTTIPVLSYREKQVIKLIAQAKSNHEIARELFTTVPMVKKTLNQLFEKTECRSRTQLAIMAIQTNYFQTQKVA